MATLDRKLIRDLAHIRGQLIAIALVVACGVSAFVSMGSTYFSLLHTQQAYYDQFRFADVFAQLKRAPDTLSTQIAAIPGVASVRTRIVMEVTLDLPGLAEPATGRLVSLPERQTMMLNDLFLRQGRYIEPDHPDEIIASEAFANANQLQVGDGFKAIINGRLRPLRIVGIALSPEYIYEVRGGGSIFPDNKRFGILWMSHKVLATAFNLDGAFNDVAIRLSPNASEPEVIAQLDRLLTGYGGLGAYGRDEQTSNRFISDEIAQNKFSSTIIPLIFLSVASFLLHIILSRLVNIERNQIAILKAFGYRNFTIGVHYLKLALVPVWGGVIFGTLSGTYLGQKLTELYTLYYHFPFLRYEASLELFAFAILITLSTAGLSVVSALRSAVNIPPAEAMRPEPPAAFNQGWLDKLGIHRLFPPAIRMILRNIERRPIKAFLSVLGVAVSVAILVIGMYFFDAFDHLMKVQYEFVQRQNVTVAFNEVRPPRVIHELERLPGVLRSEPFRAVPVRLRFQHYSRRVAILGLQPDSELRCLVDKDLNTQPIPPEGVVLTKKLAEILHVVPGDVLRVEILEGRRAMTSIPVSGLVDELLGLSVYMDVRALMQLLGEDNTVSGAYLKVDPLLINQLYAELKRMPAVSGVGLRDVEIESIHQTIQQNMAVSTTMLIVFAGVIAFGIVYNSARIALSERGRELASLRVLGFLQAEVSFMLLGEQAILTLTGIPLGCAIGFGVCAWIPHRLNTELYRMPLVINSETYVAAFLIVALAAFLSGLFVRWRIRGLDLIAVLKTRE
ncbi:MAG TPA: ABC transporter permease [Acidobacteriota bacterium]|nr:ABC transporter permease [Acidobacteriota bacterium]HNH82935.1 ABC transporter permease [Acidobacteriota bacterium]